MIGSPLIKILNGILNINKPRGLTSFAVVAAVKRSCGERHAGHAGTLDPIATGVLPVCLGNSTRVVEYLMDTAKTYRTQIGLGRTTDTYDAEGVTLKTADASPVTRSQIEGVITCFRGEIQQVPPVYSALKQHGKPLYRYAREGTIVTPVSRTITIYTLDLLDWQPPVITLRISCSKGTYIRSLANDIGVKLGCGAYMMELVREKYGPFDIKDAVSLSQVDDACRTGTLESILYPVDAVLTNMPSIVLNADDTRKIINGIDLDSKIMLQSTESSQLTVHNSNQTNIPQFTENRKLETGNYKYCRAYSAGGALIAVLKYRDESVSWHPEKVFLTI